MTSGWAPAALDSAQRSVSAMDQLPDGLTIDDAYAVQHGVLACRRARGERLAGIKLGFTSKAKMAQMGVSEIIVGQLTDAMQVADDGQVELSRFIHPRIEPEVAYRLSRDVDDSVNDLATCVDAIAAGLEIIDSRYRDFRFDLPGVIADNASAAGFVIGAWQPFGLDAGDLEVRLVVDGAVAELGSTSDILGNPANALPALLRMARRYGLPLRGGDVVLAGAATAAVPFIASTVQAQIAGLGTATVRGLA